MQLLVHHKHNADFIIEALPTDAYRGVAAGFFDIDRRTTVSEMLVFISGLVHVTFKSDQEAL